MVHHSHLLGKHIVKVVLDDVKSQILILLPQPILGQVIGITEVSYHYDEFVLS